MRRSTDCEVFYGQELDLGPDQRRVRRFTLKEQHLWAIKVDGKSVPIEFVQDLNWQGARLRLRDTTLIRHKEHLSFKVFFRGQQLFSTRGKVRWISDASVHLGLQSVGLEFEDPNDQIEEVWRTSRVGDVVGRDTSGHAAMYREKPTWRIEALALRGRLDHRSTLFFTALLGILYFFMQT